ncbi:camp-regulated phosphoprotein/endosulfine conserved region-domain-containing protein [Lipomyces oligophaga]|uniref:camp-regulated phosphoprotein/endosulfine conserved region-domain-containing protein n=1 Tax=Lipomyces oligophaga TaxID=45792 RepID=UPI0034CDC273
MSSIDPARTNKVDISTLSPDEQRMLRMYGRLPSRHDILQNKLKDRKYFDSGDYALSKAGRAGSADVTNVGSQHPVPENIPHSHTNSFSGPSSSTPGSSTGSSPVIPGASFPSFAGSLANSAGSPTSISSSPVKESHLIHEAARAEE